MRRFSGGRFTGVTVYFVYAEAPDTGMERCVTVWGHLHVTDDDAKARGRSLCE